jgi:hypothetical protein
MPPKTTQELLDAALDRLISDARAAAKKRKTTLKAVSKAIFGDTRTLPSIIKGKRKTSVGRIEAAAILLKEMEDQ